MFEAYPRSILPLGFEFYLLNFLVCSHLQMSWVLPWVLCWVLGL